MIRSIVSIDEVIALQVSSVDPGRKAIVRFAAFVRLIRADILGLIAMKALFFFEAGLQCKDN